MKIINFTFFFTFLNKTTFKDKIHMILVQGLCRNPKQIKNGKKGTGHSFQRKKRCFVLSAGNIKKN